MVRGHHKTNQFETIHPFLDGNGRQPTVNVNALTRELKISHVSADKLLRTFVKAGLLKEITGFKRNRLFHFKRYLDLFLK